MRSNSWTYDSWSAGSIWSTQWASNQGKCWDNAHNWYAYIFCCILYKKFLSPLPYFMSILVTIFYHSFFLGQNMLHFLF